MFENSQSENFLITDVVKNKSKNACYGILFHGDLDNIVSYYVDGKSYSVDGSNFSVGDVVFAEKDYKVFCKDIKNSQNKRIENLFKFVENVTKCSESKMLGFLETGQTNNDNRPFVWQYSHALTKVGRGFGAIFYEDNFDLTRKKQNYIKNMLKEVFDSSKDISLSAPNYKQINIFLNEVETLKTLFQMREKNFDQQIIVPKTCDEFKSTDYFLVTNINEYGNVDGIVLSNIFDKKVESRKLIRKLGVFCDGEKAFVGDLIPIYKTPDGKSYLEKQSQPISFEHRMKNMFFVNEKIAEQLNLKKDDSFDNSLAVCQMELSKSVSLQINKNFIGEEEKSNVLQVFGYNLFNKYKNSSKSLNMTAVKSFNSQTSDFGTLFCLKDKDYKKATEKQTSLFDF